MSEAFDPYRKWLGIPTAEQPPNHYRLLGLGLFEDDADTIDDAADRQMAHVQTHKTGPHGPLSQKLLNELAAARLCLLDPQQKAAYDDQLRRSSTVAAPLPPLAPMEPLPPVARPLPMLPIANAGLLPLPAAAFPWLPRSLPTAPLPFGDMLAPAEPATFTLFDWADVGVTRNSQRGYRRRASNGWPACGVLMLLAGIFVGVLIWNKDEIRARSRARSKPVQARPYAAAPQRDHDRHTAGQLGSRPGRQPGRRGR